MPGVSVQFSRLVIVSVPQGGKAVMPFILSVESSKANRPHAADGQLELPQIVALCGQVPFRVRRSAWFRSFPTP